jgi:hypothetical protein
MTNITFYGQFVSPKKISNGGQYVTLNSKIKCLSLAVCFLPTPPIKLKLHIRGGLLQQTTWTNHYDWPFKNTEPQSGPIYYTCFWRCTIVLRLLPTTASCTKLVWKNQFPELNWHILPFCNKFYCLESHTEHHWRCSNMVHDLPNLSLVLAHAFMLLSLATQNTRHTKYPPS